MRFLELKIPPPILMVLLAGLMFFISSYTASLGIAQSICNAIAIGLLAIGGCFSLSGVYCFRRAKTTINPHKPHKASSLVDNGVYRISRNPMYVGLLFLLLAMASFLDNAYALLVVGVYIIYMNAFQIGPEERALEAIFDEDFRQYKSRVRRWI